MPDKATVFRWIRTNKDFCDQYTRAKQESADALVEEMIDIADESDKDFIIDDDGNPVRPNIELMMRSKLRIETRKWISSKLKPKKYGDKLDLTSDGKRIESPAIISPIKARNVEAETEATDSN